MASKSKESCVRRKVGKSDKSDKSDKANSEALAFRDELVLAMDRSKGKLEPTWKSIYPIVAKQEYRRLVEQLFDVLYTGGLLNDESKEVHTRYCVLKTRPDGNALAMFEELFERLMRRHKHMCAAFEPHARRMLARLGKFQPAERSRLAHMITLFLVKGVLNPCTLLAVGEQASINDGLTLEFLLDLFSFVKSEKGPTFLVQMVKRAGLQGKIMSFMPPHLRGDPYFQQVYQERNLTEITKLHQMHAVQEQFEQLRQRLLDDLNKAVPYPDVVHNVRQFQLSTNMSDSEVIVSVWSTIVSQGHRLAPEEMMRHVQPYGALLNAFCGTDRAQVALLQRLQDYCHGNSSFLKAFERLVVHLYKAGVVNEEAIGRWYEVEHLDKGKADFLEQMGHFIQWLRTGADVIEPADNTAGKALTRNTDPPPKVHSDVAPGKAKLAHKSP